MNPIPVLGIPHYNRPDLTERCIRSIDYPVDTLVIVRNGPLELFPFEIVKDLRSGYRLRDGSAIRRVEVVQHPNVGVAGAWNEIIKIFPAPYWMICNNDIQFMPGDLGKMAAAGEVGNAGLYGKFYGNHGASFFAITEFGVQCVGLFDENIFPAYLEDCDWSYRADLLGVNRVTVDGVNAIHGDGRMTGSCTVNSDPQLAKRNIATHQGNFDYYARKWGGRNEKEVFKTPFNDPSWPIWAWKFEPHTRAKQQF